MTPALADVLVTDRLAGYLQVVREEAPDVPARSSLFMVALLSGSLDGLEALDVFEEPEEWDDPRTQHEGDCAECGVAFTSVTPTARYCSFVCRERASYVRSRNRARAKRESS